MTALDLTVIKEVPNGTGTISTSRVSEAPLIIIACHEPDGNHVGYASVALGVAEALHLFFDLGEKIKALSSET